MLAEQRCRLSPEAMCTLQDLEESRGSDIAICITGPTFAMDVPIDVPPGSRKVYFRVSVRLQVWV